MEDRPNAISLNSIWLPLQPHCFFMKLFKMVFKAIIGGCGFAAGGILWVGQIFQKLYFNEADYVM